MRSQWTARSASWVGVCLLTLIPVDPATAASSGHTSSPVLMKMDKFERMERPSSAAVNGITNNPNSALQKQISDTDRKIKQLKGMSNKLEQLEKKNNKIPPELIEAVGSDRPRHAPRRKP